MKYTAPALFASRWDSVRKPGENFLQRYIAIVILILYSYLFSDFCGISISRQIRVQKLTIYKSLVQILSLIYDVEAFGHSIQEKPFVQEMAGGTNEGADVECAELMNKM